MIAGAFFAPRCDKLCKKGEVKGTQAAMLAVLGALCGYEMRRIVFFRRCGFLRAALRRYRRLSLVLGLTIWCAMMTQEAVLLFSGMLTWQTGLPLHLCSLTGLLSLPMLMTQNGLLWHFSLYLGLPGAALALLFPAVPQTDFPQLAHISFYLLHACLMLAPLIPLSLGKRPTLRGAAETWIALMVLGAAVMAVNALLGSNYLFLHWPVAGTPLSWLSRQGEGMYRAYLALLATLLLAAEGLAAPRLWGRGRKIF